MIARRLVELTTESIRLKERMLQLAQEDYGLVPDVTRVRQDGMTGTFVWVANYHEPGPPWIRVNLDETAGETRRKSMNFYGEWEKIPAEE